MMKQAVAWRSAWVAIVLLLFPAGFLRADPEADLSFAQQADDAVEKLVMAGAPTPGQLVSRQEWVLARFPGTGAAAGIHMGRLRALFATNRMPEAIESADRFVSNYPSYGSLHGDLAVLLARSTHDAARTAEDRRAAFDALLRHCRGSSWALGLTRNYLSALPLDAAARYRLARAGEETCGPLAGSREYLWPFLDRYSRISKPEAVIPELERFLNRYGDDSTESVACRAILLRLRAKSGDTAAGQELERFLAVEGTNQARAAALFAACGDLAKAGRVADALRQAEGFRALPKRNCLSPFWVALFKQASGEPLDVQAGVLVLALDRLPFCQAGDELYKWAVESPLASRDDVGEALIRWFHDNPSDRQRDMGRVTKLVRRLRTPEAQLRALRTTVDLCRILDLADEEAEYLFELGRATHDVNRAESLAALQRSVERCPRSLASAKSAWLLALLKGDFTIPRPPVPRDSAPLPDTDTPPVLALPPPPPQADDFLAVSNTVTLKRRDTALNLARGRVPAASRGDDPARATDGDPATFWTPSSLPASVLVPLRESVSLERIVVKTVEPCGTVVTLLDGAGRALGKYERYWSFWENYKTPGLWPAETSEFKFLPVGPVSYIRVDFYDPLGTSGGVREIEAYASRFPAMAVQVGEPVAVPAGAKALTVRWSAVEPETNVLYRADTECSRSFPVLRWSTPWKRFPGRVNLSRLATLALDFYGTNASLELAEPGRATVSVDGGPLMTIQRAEKEPGRHVLTNSTALGWHRLILREMPYVDPVAGYQGGLEFGGVQVAGRSRVTASIRFGSGSGRWGEWIPLDQPAGTTLAVPRMGWWSRAAQYQIAREFDTREVRGTAAAVIGNLAVEPASGAGTPVPGTAAAGSTAPALREALEDVARFASERRATVVYPKTGTSREREAARRLAEKAGAYLVSDDVCMAAYPGPFLCVGRPLVHRQARQLLASRQVWNDPAYLNDADGVVGLVEGADGKPESLYVTGETVEAVEAAASRLLKALPAFKPAESFRLFESDTLEQVYAWTLHPERPAPAALEFRMGMNDRRAAQFGLAADRRLDDLSFTCTPLRSEAGGELAPLLVRTAGFYEWIPFFGDLRVPSPLLEKPSLPVPARTAFGVWVTAESRKETAPGIYRGLLTVASGGETRIIPVRVTVEPVPLPDYARARTYSFSYVPGKWFNPGSPAYANALRELARNEAVHGISVVSPRLGFEADYLRASNGWSFASRFDIAEMKVFEEVNRALGREAPQFLVYTPELRFIDRDLFHEGGNRPPTVSRMFSEQLSAFLQKAGLANRLTVKVADEPGDIREWTVMARPLREGGLRTMTCHSGNYTNIEEAVGVMNPWCPNYQHNVLRPFFKERQKAGDDVWWYCCGVPVTRVTGTPIENLPFYWLTAKWGFDGAMSYAAMHCSSFYMPVPFRYDHGLEYRFMFLPDGSTLDTNRRELEQEGINDMKVIEFVRGRVRVLRDGGKGTAADGVEAELEAILDGIVPYKYGYSQIPADWHAARARVYDLAVKAASIR